MKQNIFLLILLFFISSATYAGVATLLQGTGVPNSTSNFTVCTNGTRNFRVEYTFSSHGTCWPNPYRCSFKLFRNGVEIASLLNQLSSSTFQNWTFNNVPVTPGTYTATVKLERRPCIGAWYTCCTDGSNAISVTTNATPNGNIQGVVASSTSSPLVNVCASNIILNAAATSCETAYWVGVWETTDNPGERTYNYEWGKWYTGQAPSNINLQQIATSCTSAATGWINGPAPGSSTVPGSTMIGGTILYSTNPAYIGRPRHYRVEICTNEPSWQCKTILMRVDGNCRMAAQKIIDDEELSVYPSPAQANFTIHKNDIEKYSINIYNSVGQKIRIPSTIVSINEIIFNTLGIAKGLYYVRLTDKEGKNSTRKIMFE